MRLCSRLSVPRFALTMLATCLLLLSLLGCGEDSAPTTPLTGFSVANDLSARVATWRLDKPAAMTPAFDDARACNYEIIAPALEKHGFRGTFNLNTGAVGSNWKPYVDMAARGHELGNHTRSHRNLDQLSLDEARVEIERGRQDLLDNVPSMRDVVTFTYPEGGSNPGVRAIALEKHLSARGYWGWNPSSPQDYSMIMGRSYAGLDQIEQDVLQAIVLRAWLVAYFHVVGPGGMPEEEFGNYLNYVAAWKDSLWVAPQGEIAKYTLERDGSTVRLAGGNPGILYLETSLDPVRFDVPLSVCITAAWDGLDVLLVDGAAYLVSEGRPVWVDVAPGDTVRIEGRALCR